MIIGVTLVFIDFGICLYTVSLPACDVCRLGVDPYILCYLPSLSLSVCLGLCLIIKCVCVCVFTVCACSFSCLCVCYIALVLSSIIYYWILLDNVIIGTASHLSIRLYFTNRRSFHSPLGYCCCYWLLNECSLCLCLCLYSWLILHEGSCTLTLIVCLYLLTVNSLHLPPLPVSRLDCFWCCYLIIRLSPSFSLPHLFS